jgi:hypothetical protein
MEAEPTKAKPPKRRRRWFQFSLRTLMLMMLLVGVGMTWLVALKHQAERQRIAVETILKDGGFVTYDYQEHTLPSGVTTYSDNATPPGPLWLRKPLGDDFFVNVIGARIVTQAGLDQLARLPRLQRLEISTAVITDSSLDQLNELPRLYELD